MFENDENTKFEKKTQIDARSKINNNKKIQKFIYKQNTFTTALQRKLLRKHSQKSQCHRRLRQLQRPPPVHICVVVCEMINQIGIQKINQHQT